MDSRLTMALAGILFLGALLAGYWGLTMSRTTHALPDALAQESAQSLSGSESATALRVVAARDITAYSTLKPEDLKTEAVAQTAPGEFSDPLTLLGKTVWKSIAAGTSLSDGMLEPGGALSSMIRPDERAVAVAVDEVVAAGGHMAPGDFVDVLVYLRANNGAGYDPEQEQDSAMVVVSAARLLSYGALLGPNAGSYQKPVKEGEEQATPEVVPGQIRSAVIAIPQALSSTFMLASQVGQVRLAVRSKQEKLHEHYERGDLTVLAEPSPRVLMSTLTGVTPKPREITPIPVYARPAPAAQAARPRAVAPRPSANTVEVIRGTQRQQLTPSL